MTDESFVSIELPSGLTALLAEGQKTREIRFGEIETLLPEVKSIGCAACSLFFEYGDAMQVIEALESIGYAGPLLVVAPKLPNHQMVQTELSREARRIKVSLISP